MKGPVDVNGRESELVQTIDAAAFRRNILALNAALVAAQSSAGGESPRILDTVEHREVTRAPGR